MSYKNSNVFYKKHSMGKNYLPHVIEQMREIVATTDKEFQIGASGVDQTQALKESNAKIASIFSRKFKHLNAETAKIATLDFRDLQNNVINEQKFCLLLQFSGLGL